MSDMLQGNSLFLHRTHTSCERISYRTTVPLPCSATQRAFEKSFCGHNEQQTLLPFGVQTRTSKDAKNWVRVARDATRSLRYTCARQALVHNFRYVLALPTKLEHRSFAVTRSGGFIVLTIFVGCRLIHTEKDERHQEEHGQDSSAGARRHEATEPSPRCVQRNNPVCGGETAFCGHRFAEKCVIT